MRDAVLAALPGCDALVMAAAVADFRPRTVAPAKLARSEGLRLELEPTADILAEAAAMARTADDPARRPLIVGFAAETGSLERAPEKAARKGVDLLVANDVSEPGSGFGTETNRVTIIVPGQPPEPWPPGDQGAGRPRPARPPAAPARAGRCIIEPMKPATSAAPATRYPT